MKKEKFDKKMQEQIISGTEYPKNLKDDIWNNIEKQIDKKEKEVVTLPPRSSMKSKKKGFRKMGIIGTTAASLVIAITLIATDTGSALMDHVRQLFEPEKVITEEIEGIESESNVTLQEGQAGYVIYFDKDMYSMVEVDGKDRIIFNEELPDIYPDVYMEISQQDEQPRSLADQMFEQLSEQYPTVLEVSQVEQPLNSFVVHAVGGTGGYEWDDPVVRYYFFSNEKDGSFVVKQIYFLEAEEGHGARFDHMLEEFFIFDETEN